MLKQVYRWQRLKSREPAAFRRLCVETTTVYVEFPFARNQPPLGGCVLKLGYRHLLVFRSTQPPLGGCVLKPEVPDGGGEPDCQPPLGGCVLKPLRRGLGNTAFIQPPLGGCVLKHALDSNADTTDNPAAFRRLCVET